ncbi:hypothetical protein BMS3Abin17_00385 [archaeon BMS3Abin17]|nr:hypothetical protein BMS3Abin17_00385 [archaeon BMS3Abin17]HDZ60249.1 hypothetical protein [Candidatus Pacearchaeota archaeon]
MIKRILRGLVFSAVILYPTSLAFGYNLEIERPIIRANSNNIYDSEQIPKEDIPSQRKRIFLEKQAVIPENFYDVLTPPKPEKDSEDITG